MTKIFVKPALARPGLVRPSGDGQPGEPITHRVVRDPVTGVPLPAEGAEVELTTYIRRRLRDGDVVKASRPATSTKAAPAAEKKG